MANAYADGHGVQKDNEEAAKWYLQSARNGFSYAQNSIGYFYEHGIGVPCDYGEAVRWFRSAQNKNCEQPSSISVISINTARGYHVTMLGQPIYTAKPRPKAYQQRETHWHLCICMAPAFRKNPIEAFNLLRLAAEQGLPAAQQNLD